MLSPPRILNLFRIGLCRQLEAELASLKEELERSKDREARVRISLKETETTLREYVGLLQWSQEDCDRLKIEVAELRRWCYAPLHWGLRHARN